MCVRVNRGKEGERDEVFFHEEKEVGKGRGEKCGRVSEEEYGGECEHEFARVRQGEWWCVEGNLECDGVCVLDEQWRRRREVEACDTGSVDGDGRACSGCREPSSSAA